jgi:hypothetical protein
MRLVPVGEVNVEEGTCIYDVRCDWLVGTVVQSWDSLGSAVRSCERSIYLLRWIGADDRMRDGRCVAGTACQGCRMSIEKFNI